MPFQTGVKRARHRKGEGAKHTETNPLAKQLSIGNLDERDLVLGAKGNNKLLVGFLLAALVEHAHVRLATIESLGRLAQTASETVVDQGNFQDALERVKHRHLAARAGVGGHFDLIGLGDGGVGNGLFSVRLFHLSLR